MRNAHIILLHGLLKWYLSNDVLLDNLHSHIYQIIPTFHKHFGPEQNNRNPELFASF